MFESPMADAKDDKMVRLIQSHTNLEDDDIQILLEVSHSLPFIANLEHGDTYINVLTPKGESLVVAQYRHPQCDLYKRDIVGEMEKKADEPAVYRALEQGVSSRGFIGIIDNGRMIVRHTVSPIFNKQQKVIGALTNEYFNAGPDTEPIRVKNIEGSSGAAMGQIDKLNQVTGYLQDGYLLYDENGICIFANAKAEEIYRRIGYGGDIIGRSYEEMQLTGHSRRDVYMEQGIIQEEVHFRDVVLNENISAIREDGEFQGIAIILQDRTRIAQMEDEIAYRDALLHETHHRVKNNLQTIISLVGLEAMQTKNDEVKKFAKTITSHIRSMSVAYDLLAHTETESVGVKTMLNRVANGFLENGNEGIKIEVNGDDVLLHSSTASTVALVVNELIQNSMKYAFRDRDSGRIWLDIEQGEGVSRITVRDDGCGFDKNISTGGLGMRIIDALVKSCLKGQVTVDSSSQGTVTSFSFRTSV